MFIRMKVFTGTVFRISPTINSATRSFIAELELPNRNDMLKPGNVCQGIDGSWRS